MIVNEINTPEKIIELHPLALNYISLLRTTGLLNPYSDDETLVNRKTLEEGLNQSLQHKLVLHLNKQPGFVIARNKFISNGLIISNQIDMVEPKDFLHAIGLEFTCANIICSHFGNSDSIKNAVIPKKKINSMKLKARRFLEQIESTDGFIFESEYEQHIYLYLTRKLLVNSESIFNSGKSHKQLLREFFIKKNIQLLYSIFNQQQQSPSFYADITIDIASIFFADEMDRSDCIKLADRIIQRVNNDLIFMHSTVGNWFYQAAQEILSPQNQL